MLGLELGLGLGLGLFSVVFAFSHFRILYLPKFLGANTLKNESSGERKFPG